MNNWFDFFSSFFTKYESEIETILYANGCREGWVQGQMYLYSEDDYFSVNTYQLPDNKCKVDIEGRKPFANCPDDPMIAEIKIIASSFLTKNINGRSNIDEFSKYKRKIPITKEHLDNVDHQSGSILKDVVRLQSVADDIKKIMILIIPIYDGDDQNTKLGLALRNISLSDKYLEINFQGFDIRLWELNIQ